VPGNCSATVRAVERGAAAGGWLDGAVGCGLGVVRGCWSRLLVG